MLIMCLTWTALVLAMHAERSIATLLRLHTVRDTTGAHTGPLLAAVL